MGVLESQYIVWLHEQLLCAEQQLRSCTGRAEIVEDCCETRLREAETVLQAALKAVLKDGRLLADTVGEQRELCRRSILCAAGELLNAERREERDREASIIPGRGGGKGGGKLKYSI